ncbi:MAG: phosphoribosyltransferase [Hoeflea sp.]|uniref:phosphoribosyltransferase n=1 Tax=Hoeflea sp. TaxID=1940281 RepID=UPI0027314A8E|nr:phosphoribosyltransferase [Hoeflea sp.]MDP2122455.1 phosphoribosyltransferase [Hoeflea sp.]
MLFADRSQAGRMLVERLPDLDQASTVVVALPRGGVPVAREIARAFGLPLEIVLVRKVGVPGHPELALGAVSDGDDMKLTVNRDIAGVLGLEDEAIRSLAREEMPELERRQKLYGGDRPPVSVRGKTVVVVDDGVATGATLRAALQVLRQRGAARLILALPVAPAEVLEDLRRLADSVICLSTPSPFHAVGAHYAVFDQVTDLEVIRILDEMYARNGTAAGNGLRPGGKAP